MLKSVGPVLVRYKTWGPVLVVFGLLILFGSLMAIGDTKVDCGPDTMRTEDICREYYKNSGEPGVRMSYDQQRERNHALSLAGSSIGSLMTIGGIVLMVMARRYLPGTPQNRYAAPSGPPPYLPPPAQPYYPPPAGQQPYPAAGNPTYHPPPPSAPTQ